MEHIGSRDRDPSPLWRRGRRSLSAPAAMLQTSWSRASTSRPQRP